MGRGGGQRLFGSFPKKHPVWEIQSPHREVKLSLVTEIFFSIIRWQSWWEESKMSSVLVKCFPKSRFLYLEVKQLSNQYKCPEMASVRMGWDSWGGLKKPVPECKGSSPFACLLGPPRNWVLNTDGEASITLDADPDSDLSNLSIMKEVDVSAT